MPSLNSKVLPALSKTERIAISRNEEKLGLDPSSRIVSDFEGGRVITTRLPDGQTSTLIIITKYKESKP